MRITNITTENFRNLKNLEWDVAQDFVVLSGPNASGKTNFLESLFYTSVLRAFPPGKSWDLIAFGAEYFRVTVKAEEKTHQYYYGRKEEKKYTRSQTINGVKKKAAEVAGLLPMVSFLPQDLNLLQSSPSLRREYLDEILLQTEPGYEEVVAEYSRVLAQRNELLTRISMGEAQERELDFWDDKLASLGSSIMNARTRLSEFLDAGLGDLYAELVGSEIDVRFLYTTTSGVAEISSENLYDQLARVRAQDIRSGRTEVGPHRDDWRIEDTSARNLSRFLSRGEQKSVVIALKMQEQRFLRETLGLDPIILLDELLAELDQTRQKHLLDHLPKTTQKFLTATELEAIPQNIRSQALVITFPA